MGGSKTRASKKRSMTSSQEELYATRSIKNRYSLKELVNGITPYNRHAEVNFGRPVGKEVLEEYRERPPIKDARGISKEGKSALKDLLRGRRKETK